MPKNFSILVFMFLMLQSYGQKSTLLQNINFRAKELKHGLNEVGDSLFLTSNKTIYSVEIFNQDFEKVVEVASNETKIALNGTPLGRLVVQAKMQNKRILMTLLRHEEIEIIPEESLANKSNQGTEIVEREFTHAEVITNTNPITIEYDVALNTKSEQIFVFVPAPLEPEVDISERVISFAEVTSKNLSSIIEYTISLNTKDEHIFITAIQAPIKYETETLIVSNKEEPKLNVDSERSLSSMLNWKPKKTNRSDKVFWISYVVDSGTSSRKSMRLVNQIEAEQLISRCKIENKTPQGKLNRLTIWKVFSPIEFIKKQSENPDYIHSAQSDLFDVKPYFSTKNNLSSPNFALNSN